MLEATIKLLNERFGEQAIVNIIDKTIAKERLGYYDHRKRTINICVDNITNNDELLHVCLHEYARYLQHIEEPTCFDYYKQECMYYGYENHPLEIAAEQFAAVWFNSFNI